MEEWIKRQTQSELWEGNFFDVIDSFKEAYNEFEIKQQNAKYTDFYLKQGARSVIAAIETKGIPEIYSAFNNILYTSFTDIYLNEVWLKAIELLGDDNLDASNSWNMDANEPDNDTNRFCYNLHNFDFINFLYSFMSFYFCWNLSDFFSNML